VFEQVPDPLEQLVEEIPAGVDVVLRVVERVAVAVQVLGISRLLNERVGADEPG
jgi:hypothetical protein